MLCQIVNLESAAANNSVSGRNNVVVKCRDNPNPSNPRADDANDTVADTVPPAFVAVRANDSVKPSSVNNAVADRANDITATAPPPLAKPFAFANDNNSPPFDTVTASNAVPDPDNASTNFVSPNNSPSISGGGGASVRGGVISVRGGVKRKDNDRSASTAPSVKRKVNP